MTLVFLVYDSRSGSTLLSREIAAQFPDAYVSPEIRFDALFGRPAAWWRHAGDGRVRQLLEAGRVPQKLELADADVGQLSDARGIRPLIEALVSRAAAREGRSAPAVAVIKSGRHLRAARRILADIPDARFVFVVRDPRAAIASKLVTDRPYVPGQKMAWAGPFAAALQWRWYGRLARELARAAPVHSVPYEALLADPAGVLEALARFLSIRRALGGARYRVPDAERAIHGRVLAGGVDASRAAAWRSELSREDQTVIEILCGSEMRRWGYEAELHPGPLRALALVVKSFLVSAARIAREAAARFAGSR
jgi:sulfotransferase family protein